MEKFSIGSAGKKLFVFSLCTSTMWLVAFSMNIAMADQSVPGCSDPTLNLRTVSPGFKCAAAPDGKIWERVDGGTLGETWKDPGGFVWTDIVGQATNRGLITRKTIIGGEVVGKELVLSKAIRMCRKIGARLPNATDFWSANHYGASEVLPNYIGSLYWTASVPRGGPDVWVPEPHKVAWDWAANSRVWTENLVGFSPRKDKLNVRCVFGDDQ